MGDRPGRHERRGDGDPTVSVHVGGDVHQSAIAAGRDSRASVEIRSPAQVQALADARVELARLLRLLEEHRDEVPEPETVRADAEDLAAELDRDAPDAKSSLRLVRLLASGVGSATGLVNAAAALHEALRRLFG